MTPTPYRTSLAISAIVLSFAVTGCVSPQEAHYQDQDTCAGMGARPGASAHTQCMLQQQQRRDQELLNFTQQAYMHSEMARNAQEMRESRRDRR
jgi:hypothetical protein